MNEKWILRFVLIFVLLMIGLSLLFPHNKTISNVEEFTFSTSSDSRLYFKNIRSFWYQLKENEVARINIYNHKKLDSTQLSGLRVQILDQWNVDEASIQYYQIGDSSQVEWAFTSKGDQIRFQLDTMNREDHVWVALWCFRKQLSGDSIQLLSDNNQQIGRSDIEKKAYQETLMDYFELTNFYK